MSSGPRVANTVLVPGESIWRDLSAFHCDAAELQAFLLSDFKSAIGARDDPRILYFPGDASAYAVKLVFGKRGLVDICAGPILTASALEELKDRISESLIHGGSTGVAKRILFSPVPVLGAYRFDKSFQITPVPPEAPRGSFPVPEHPFLLEFKFLSSVSDAVSQIREDARARELERVLNVLLNGFIHSHGSLRHHWVYVIGADGRNPEAHLYQQGYTFNGFVRHQEEFTPADCLETLNPVPANEYYARGGISSGQVLDVPSNLEGSLRAYEALPQRLAAQFGRASYWLQHSERVWRDCKSAAYVALVSALEAVMPESEERGTCRQCGRLTGAGPTKRFRKFLDAFAPAGSASSSSREKLYAVRSALTHGGRLFVGDEQPFKLGALDAFEESQTYSDAHQIARVELVNWLHCQESS